MIPIPFELFVSVTDTSNTKGRTILSCGDGEGWGGVSLVRIRLLHSFCGRNKNRVLHYKQRNILQAS